MESVHGKSRNRKTQIGIFIVLLIIAVMVLSLLPVIHHIGQQRAKEGKHSFEQYVVAHHLGTLTVIDTGTGIDPVSYVLTLRHTVPDAQRLNLMLQLMDKYVTYDQGQTLSVMYYDRQTSKNLPIGFAQYDMHTHVVHMVITHPSGGTSIVDKTVDW